MNDQNRYGQYCPIARSLDVLGERWTLMILRDMLVGATRFNDLARGLPRLSRGLLTKRLRQLEVAGLVERVDGNYVLTDAGRQLEPIVFALGEWGARWTFGPPRADELDAELLVWWMHKRLDTSALPAGRSVISLTFRDDPRPFWIVVESGEPSVCLTDPGYEVDVWVKSDLPTLYDVWLGRLPVSAAVREDRLAFIGATALTRRMPDVFQLSPVADLVASNPFRP